MTTAAGAHVVPIEPASLPQLRAADRGVASSLESVLADNTRRVYDAQWRIFTGWCDEVGLSALPAEPLTVARYLAARAGSGASIATLRLVASAITKAHEWAELESPVNFHGHGPGLTTVIDPPWKHGDLIDSRLLLVGQSPPSVLSRARCGDSRSL